jgi:Arc/MetJ family transcription regulator
MLSAADDDKFGAKQETYMRTARALDEDLVAKAQAVTGIKERSSLVHEALKALIERDSARLLARLGGSEAALKAAPGSRSN